MNNKANNFEEKRFRQLKRCLTNDVILRCVNKSDGRYRNEELLPLKQEFFAQHRAFDDERHENVVGCS